MLIPKYEKTRIYDITTIWLTTKELDMVDIFSMVKRKARNRALIEKVDKHVFIAKENLNKGWAYDCCAQIIDGLILALLSDH